MNEKEKEKAMSAWLAGYFSWEESASIDDYMIAEDGWHAGFNAAMRLLKESDK